MFFGYPEYLWLVILACVLTSFLCLWTLRRKRKWLKEYRRLGLLERLGKIPRTWSEISRVIIIGAVVLSLGLVLLKPQIKTVEPYFEKEKLEFVFALDLSRSTLAEIPSRLDLAKREVENLVRTLEIEDAKYLVGLVVFTNKAFLLSPLTYDWEGIFLRSLDTIDEGFVRYGLPQQGTNIGEALRESVLSFSDEPVGKILILLTDGEAQGEESELEASMAEAIKILSKTEGISVYIIGVGDPSRDSYIPTEDKKDYERVPRTGTYIRTRPNPRYLKELAKLTGGTYKHSATGEELKDNLAEILKMERRMIQKGTRTVYKDISQYILGLVLVLLSVYYILTLGKLKWSKPPKRNKIGQSCKLLDRGSKSL